MLFCLFIAALWLPAGNGLTSWLSCMWCFVTFPCSVLGQVWWLIVSIPDLCLLSYFAVMQDVEFSVTVIGKGGCDV